MTHSKPVHRLNAKFKTTVTHPSAKILSSTSIKKYVTITIEIISRLCKKSKN